MISMGLNLWQSITCTTPSSSSLSTFCPWQSSLSHTKMSSRLWDGNNFWTWYIVLLFWREPAWNRIFSIQHSTISNNSRRDEMLERLHGCPNFDPNNFLKSQRKKLRMSLTQVLVFLLCWGPYVGQQVWWDSIHISQVIPLPLKSRKFSE